MDGDDDDGDAPTPVMSRIPRGVVGVASEDLTDSLQHIPIRSFSALSFHDAIDASIDPSAPSSSRRGGADTNNEYLEDSNIAMFNIPNSTGEGADPEITVPQQLQARQHIDEQYRRPGSGRSRDRSHLFSSIDAGGSGDRGCEVASADIRGSIGISDGGGDIPNDADSAVDAGGHTKGQLLGEDGSARDKSHGHTAASAIMSQRPARRAARESKRASRQRPRLEVRVGASADKSAAICGDGDADADESGISSKGGGGSMNSGFDSDGTPRAGSMPRANPRRGARARSDASYNTKASTAGVGNAYASGGAGVSSKDAVGRRPLRREDSMEVDDNPAPPIAISIPILDIQTMKQPKSSSRAGSLSGAGAGAAGSRGAKAGSAGTSTVQISSHDQTRANDNVVVAEDGYQLQQKSMADSTSMHFSRKQQEQQHAPRRARNRSEDFTASNKKLSDLNIAGNRSPTHARHFSASESRRNKQSHGHLLQQQEQQHQQQLLLQQQLQQQHQQRVLQPSVPPTQRSAAASPLTAAGLEDSAEDIMSIASTADQLDHPDTELESSMGGADDEASSLLEATGGDFRTYSTDNNEDSANLGLPVRGGRGGKSGGTCVRVRSISRGDSTDLTGGPSPSTVGSGSHTPSSGAGWGAAAGQGQGQGQRQGQGHAHGVGSLSNTTFSAIQEEDFHSSLESRADRNQLTRGGDDKGSGKVDIKHKGALAASVEGLFVDDGAGLGDCKCQ